jgi:hypothetical protein
MWRSGLVLAGILGGCAPLPPRGTAAADHAGGLPAPVLLPEPDADSLVLHLAVRAGTSFDPVGREGLSSSVARALLDGAIGPALVAAGAVDVDADVGPELVEVRARCPSSRAGACALALARAVVTEPLPADAPTDSAGSEALAWDALRAVAYVGHPYAHGPRARESVRALLRSEERELQRASTWTRVGTTLGLAGAFEPTLVHEVEAVLSALPARPPLDHPLFRPEPRLQPRLLAVPAPTGETVALAGRAVDTDPTSPAWAALAVALAALGPSGGADGALAITPRSPAAGAWVAPDAAARHPLVVVGLDGGADRARGTLAALRRTVESGLDPARVEVAREVLASALESSASSSATRLGFAVHAVASGRPDVGVVAAPAVRAVDAAAADAALRALGSAWHLGVAGPEAAGWAEAGLVPEGAATVRPPEALHR